jgi:uncharacterized RDD family membrane protein YckC
VRTRRGRSGTTLGIEALALSDDGRFCDPSRRYLASFAAAWRRLVAGTVDWGICFVTYLVIGIPLGVVEALGATMYDDRTFGRLPGAALAVVAQVLSFIPFVAYFAYLWPTSQTFGMRVMDIRLVCAGTGRGPSRRRAILRAVIAMVVAAGVYLVVMRETSFEKSHLDHLSRVLMTGAYALAIVAGVSALTSLVSPTGRSLFDRIFGTVVVDDLESLEPVAGPFGPLDVFETAHESAAGRRV